VKSRDYFLFYFRELSYQGTISLHLDDRAFLGVGSLYLSILWVILYFSAFVIEEAQRNIWLWIVIGIVVMASIVAIPIRRYYFDL